jgi:hypothetical protein
VPFADWTFCKSDADLIAAVDLSNPLVGSGSLRLSNVNDKSIASNVHGYYTATTGFVRGKIRSLVKVETASNRARAGLYCCASTPDLTATGSAYYTCLQADASGGSRTIQLFKATAGFDQEPPGGLLANVAHAAFTIATTHCLELEWQIDATVLAGTRLIVRFGSQTDFSDLAEVLDYTDVSSPLVVSAGEGVCLVKWGVASDLAEARFDSTTIVPLV